MRDSAIKRNIFRLTKRSRHWLILLSATDLVFLFAVWIVRREALRYMLLFILLFTAIALTAGLSAEFFRQRREDAALLDFLSAPNDGTRDSLLSLFDHSEASRTLCAQFSRDLSLINEKTMELAEYRDYIEAWVHEAKTPLSLFALVLGNHRDEMSDYVYLRLNYMERQLNEDVERILYYARLQADHSDIKFTRFRLDACVEDMLSEYRVFAQERAISVTSDLLPVEAVSDRKVVSFLLSQLIGNAVKYADCSHGELSVRLRQEGENIRLCICNNGDGVPPEDMPFIFDKGFTGNHINRRKATGMGLYLVRKYAELLCIEVQPLSQIPYSSGFGIELVFKR